MAIFLACALLAFSSGMLTDSWHIVNDGPSTLFLGQFAWNFDSRPYRTETASGATDTAETTARVAQTEATAHFP